MDLLNKIAALNNEIGYDNLMYRRYDQFIDFDIF